VGLEPPVEVLGQGHDDPAATRLTDWFQRHRGVTAALLGVAVLTGLAGAGALVIRDLRGPALPPVTVLENPAAPPTVSWYPGPDQRPGPVRLQGVVRVRRTPPKNVDTVDPADGVMTLLAVTGPGIVRTDLRPTEVFLTSPAEQSFVATIDCRAVPEALSGPGDGFGVRIRFEPTGGGRSLETDVATAESGRSWAAAVSSACGSWLARRDLTVTQLSTRADPASTSVAVTLTVTNRGSRAATLSPVGAPGQAIRLQGRLPVRVPPHASIAVPLTVVLDRCDPVPDPRDVDTSAALAQQLTTVIELVARVGGGPPTPIRFVDIDGADVGTTGILMAGEPTRALAAAMSAACGGMGPVVPLVLPETVRYDSRSRIMTVPLRIDMDRDRALSVRLTAQRTVAGRQFAFQPLWSRTPALRPDPTGQVTVVLRYRAPPGRSCPSLGAFVPGFDATVATADGRRVHYRSTIELGTDPHAIQILCAPNPQDRS
jgi:hypothetical protein